MADEQHGGTNPLNDPVIEEVQERMQRDNLPVGRMVAHRNGHLGWVLQEDNVGRGIGKLKPGRPTIQVLTTRGQRVWWYQEACSEIIEAG